MPASLSAISPATEYGRKMSFVCLSGRAHLPWRSMGKAIGTHRRLRERRCPRPVPAPLCAVLVGSRRDVQHSITDGYRVPLFTRIRSCRDGDFRQVAGRRGGLQPRGDPAIR